MYCNLHSRKEGTFRNINLTQYDITGKYINFSIINKFRKIMCRIYRGPISYFAKNNPVTTVFRNINLTQYK